tara:strand:+ start:17 stop:670 length:654 start_codon:yes stop_codon:yes gene_type:complete
MVSLVLLERIPKLGQIGDKVSVKPGYARNFLLPEGKALRATKENLDKFEKIRVSIEADNLESKNEAEKVKAKLNEKTFIIIRSASDAGSLYGSVNGKDICESINNDNFKIERKQIILNKPIKELGIHKLGISLHPEVIVDIHLNVARSYEEAELQKNGIDSSSKLSSDDIENPKNEVESENSKLFDNEKEFKKSEENVDIEKHNVDLQHDENHSKNK